jgi:hypothetical protein
MRICSRPQKDWYDRQDARRERRQDASRQPERVRTGAEVDGSVRRLLHHAFDTVFGCVTDRSADFLACLECDQGALRGDLVVRNDGFLRVEVDDERGHVLEFGLAQEFANDGLLRLAGRAPVGVHGDEGRLALGSKFVEAGGSSPGAMKC